MSTDELARDMLAISRIDCVPSLLQILCESSGMGFAAIARVTESAWVACAVLDRIGMGLLPGSRLDIDTTLCKEARLSRRSIVIDRASTDPVYSTHLTPKMYRIESYISVPIVLRDGSYFGNLCAVDRVPAPLSNERVMSMFEKFAQLIGYELDNRRQHEEHQIVLRGEREISRLREQFIAVLGHDLRNPLSAIAACTALLKRVDDPQVGLLAQRLTSNVNRMADLIDDTMDLARGRLGTGLDLRVVKVADVDRALNQIVDECRDANPGSVIDAHVQTLPTLACDTRRLQQLLSNLLGNAIKHGDSSQPVEVEVRMEGSDLVIAVGNRGNPIVDDDLHRLFEPFWRRATDPPRDGLGLGLYICKQIAEAHDGQIGVYSSPSVGTRFTARLPLLAKQH